MNKPDPARKENDPKQTGAEPQKQADQARAQEKLGQSDVVQAYGNTEAAPGKGGAKNDAKAHSSPPRRKPKT